MARPLRIDVAGGWYHVTARGNERRKIFRDDRDREHFLELLGQLEERFGLAVAAYVLMENHYHLLLHTGEANLSRAMQWVGVSYSVWFNRRHGRVGHLFQGRFHAVILEEGAAAEVSRYVHLNPVRLGALQLGKTQQQQQRAGLGEPPPAELVRARVQQLRDYRWSSYRSYAGWEPPRPWLRRKAVLTLMGGGQPTENRLAKRYREFVEEAIRDGLPVSPWERLQGRLVLGGVEFVDGLRQRLRGNATEQTELRQLRQRPTFEQVVAAVETARGEAWEQWRDRHGDGGRDLVLRVARQHCELRLHELGKAVGGLDYRSVGSALRNCERRLQHDRSLAKLAQKINDEFKNKEM